MRERYFIRNFLRNSWTPNELEQIAQEEAIFIKSGLNRVGYSQKSIEKMPIEVILNEGYLRWMEKVDDTNSISALRFLNREKYAQLVFISKKIPLHENSKYNMNLPDDILSIKKNDMWIFIGLESPEIKGKKEKIVRLEKQLTYKEASELREILKLLDIKQGKIFIHTGVPSIISREYPLEDVLEEQALQDFDKFIKEKVESSQLKIYYKNPLIGFKIVFDGGIIKYQLPNERVSTLTTILTQYTDKCFMLLKYLGL